MGMIIEDGLGSGQMAGISPTGNRMNVSSRADERIYYVSRDNEDAYAVTTTDTAAAGEYNFYFQNTSTTQKFYVKDIIVTSAELAIFKLAFVTGTAAGGSAITPVNMNRISNKTASANARGAGSITGLTPDGVIGIIATSADSSFDFNIHDALILGTNDAIAIEYDQGAGATVDISMIGFYDVE